MIDNKMKKIRVSDTIRQNIMSQTIEPYYNKKIKDNLRDKKCWECSSKVFETLAKLLTLFGGIFSVAAGVFNVGLFSVPAYAQPVLSFISATLSATSLGFSQFASWNSKQSKDEITNVNIILKELGLQQVPDDIGADKENKDKDDEIKQLKDTIKLLQEKILTDNDELINTTKTSKPKNSSKIKDDTLNINIPINDAPDTIIPINDAPKNDNIVSVGFNEVIQKKLQADPNLNIMTLCTPNNNLK
jgi:hypothetical protein